jgi:UDP-N-acetylmuramyl pentapeptide phosphotransferase/UDP-N-acetylglucosamine-1-phosphate transferase
LFLSPHPSAFLLAAFLVLGSVSFYDDRHGASVSTRLLSQFLAAFLGMAALGEHALLLGDILPFWLDRTLLLVGWVWFMNLYNFMDGIDGITGVQSLCTALGAALLLALIGGTTEPLSLSLAAVIAGSCAGFLVYNWHPAKIFLGDVGSVPLGFFLGFLLIKIAAMGHPFAALILPLYYLADSGITIVKRLLRHEKIWHAHKSHFYQRAAAGEGRHDRVVLWILATNIILIGLSSLALFKPLSAFLWGVIAVALLLKKMHKSGQTG